MPTSQPTISSPTKSPSPQAQVLANVITELSEETRRVGKAPLVAIQYITVIKAPWQLGAPSASGIAISGESNFYMIQSSSCKEFGDAVAHYFRSDNFYCQEWRLEFEGDRRCTLEHRSVQLGYSAMMYGTAMENINFSWELNLGYSSAFECADDLGNFQIALQIEGRSGGNTNFDNPGQAFFDDWYYFRFAASSGAPITSINIVDVQIESVDGDILCDDCLNIPELQIGISDYSPDNFIVQLFLDSTIFGGHLHATMTFGFEVIMSPTGNRRRLQENELLREGVTLNLRFGSDSVSIGDSKHPTAYHLQERFPTKTPTDLELVEEVAENIVIIQESAENQNALWFCLAIVSFSLILLSALVYFFRRRSKKHFKESVKFSFADHDTGSVNFGEGGTTLEF